MKPQLEHVSIPNGCSLRVFHRRIPAIPFEWHHHPECELTLTLNSRGLRFIGDHIGRYDSHDLVLLPSEMPHTWASTESIDSSQPHTAVVVWFAAPWIFQVADLFPEYASLRSLMRRSAAALSFPLSAARRMETRLPGLLSSCSRERLQTTLALLAELTETEAVPLATPQNQHRITAAESAQLNRILDVLHHRFAEPLRVADLCAVANMSERTLHRLFVRHLGQSLSDYLGKLRIARACMRLVETDRPVSIIATEAGFSNLSNFNRRFRAARNMTPKEFRRCFNSRGSLPALEQIELTRRSPSLEHPIRKRATAPFESMALRSPVRSPQPM